jgi:hypothetical protein
MGRLAKEDVESSAQPAFNNQKKSLPSLQGVKGGGEEGGTRHGGFRTVQQCVTITVSSCNPFFLHGWRATLRSLELTCLSWAIASKSAQRGQETRRTVSN